VDVVPVDEPGQGAAGPSAALHGADLPPTLPPA